MSRQSNLRGALPLAIVRPKIGVEFEVEGCSFIVNWTGCTGFQSTHPARSDSTSFVGNWVCGGTKFFFGSAALFVWLLADKFISTIVDIDRSYWG